MAYKIFKAILTTLHIINYNLLANCLIIETIIRLQNLAFF